MGLISKEIKKLGIVLSFFLCLNAHAQYRLSRGLDIGLGIGSGGLLASTYFMQRQVSPLEESYVVSLKRESINSFDRIACSQWSPVSAHVSDGLAISSIFLPAYFIFQPETRKESVKIATVSMQSLILSQAIANSFKLTLRMRPFVYNPSVDLNEKLKPEARMSFFSAHTTTVSSTCFSFALAYQAYFPERKSRTAVWIAAATIPAIEGYLRVSAGKHYPSDVITGYLVGLGSSYLMHVLHKERKKGRK